MCGYITIYTCVNLMMISYRKYIVKWFRVSSEIKDRKHFSPSNVFNRNNQPMSHQAGPISWWRMFFAIRGLPFGRLQQPEHPHKTGWEINCRDHKTKNTTNDQKKPANIRYVSGGKKAGRLESSVFFWLFGSRVSFIWRLVESSHRSQVWHFQPKDVFCRCWGPVSGVATEWKFRHPIWWMVVA